MSIRSIVESFRLVPATAERQYVGQSISVPIRFGSPVVHYDDERVIVCMIENHHHCVEFKLRKPLGVVGPGLRSIVGVVRSCSTDAVDRGLGVSFVIVVEDCRLE